MIRSLMSINMIFTGRVLTCIILFCTSLMPLATAQQLAHKLPMRVLQLSSTRQGDFLMADSKGNVHRVDTTGKIILSYTPHGQGSIHTLEAWPGIRILVFFKDYQQFQFLDRFLTYSERILLPNDVVGFARCLTLSQDEQLWLIDDSDFSLKKIHAKNLNLLLSTPLDLILPKGRYQFQFMREYQNQLFVADSVHGIFVFDNMGNYRKRFMHPTSFFTFKDNELVYYHRAKQQIVMLDIYTGNELTVPWPMPVMNVLSLEKHWVINTGTELQIWRK